MEDDAKKNEGRGEFVAPIVRAWKKLKVVHDS